MCEIDDRGHVRGICLWLHGDNRGLAVDPDPSRAGFAAANPLDTTAQECPSAGCQEAVVTDQLRVKSFVSAQLASRYAMPRRLDCVGTVVVSFAPPLPASEREQYRAEVVELAGGSA